MTLEVTRRIRGNLHGSTDVSPLEDLVIAHPWVQRLRRIHQTAFLSYVFPGASHTRFEHSLGVLHLADVTWGKIMANQARLKSSISKYPRYSSKEPAEQCPHGVILPTLDLIDEISKSDYILQCLRLAALLHDVGHAPFSHSGERFLVSLPDCIKANPNMPDYIRLYLETLQAKAAAKESMAYANHETYTLLMADRILREIRQKPGAAKVPFFVEPRDVLCIIKPEIGPAPGSELLKYKLYQLGHELVSGELDVDRMDYLLRDSRESGVIYGIFDSSRILDSLAIYMDSKDQSLHVAIQLSGLAAFEDYLRARQSMYLQLYFHKTSVAAEAMLKAIAKDLGNYRLPAKVDDYAAVDEYNIYEYFEKAVQVSAGQNKDTAKQNLDRLLLHRNLWKRVYEVSGQKGETELDLAVEKACSILEKQGIRFEKVSTSVDLTRFSPRPKDGVSKNYLRLIKKDAQQFPRVLPIEDYGTFVNRAESLKIIRIYVDPGEDMVTYNRAKSALLDDQI